MVSNDSFRTSTVKHISIHCIIATTSLHYHAMRQPPKRSRYRTRARQQQSNNPSTVIQPPVRSAPVPVAAYELRIANVVCTAWLGKTQVSLRKIQLVTQGRLDVSVFPSCVSRVRYPATTNALFHTGKLLVTGARSETEALYACWRYCDKINTELFDEDVQVFNFKVQNIVSSFAVGFLINVKLFYRHQKCTAAGRKQHSTLFVGACWRLNNGIAFVVFPSGSVVLTGARTWPSAWSAYQYALPILARYWLGHEDPEVLEEVRAQRQQRKIITAAEHASMMQHTRRRKKQLEVEA